MRYVKVEDGEVVSTELPSVGQLADGRTVSGFDKLPADILFELGWFPVEDAGAPEYDPETQVVVHTFDVEDDCVSVSYEIFPRPEVEVPPVVETPLSVQEQLDALMDILFSKGSLTLEDIEATRGNTQT